MKKTALLFSLQFLFIFAANAQARPEKEVAAAVEKFNKALVDADKNQLENLTSEELSYGHSGGTLEDKATFTNGVVNGTFDFITVEAEDQTIEIIDDIAVVRHKLVGTGTDKGKPSDGKIGNLMIWKKQAGQWKLLARQGYKL